MKSGKLGEKGTKVLGEGHAGVSEVDRMSIADKYARIVREAEEEPLQMRRLPPKGTAASKNE